MVALKVNNPHLARAVGEALGAELPVLAQRRGVAPREGGGGGAAPRDEVHVELVDHEGRAACASRAPVSQTTGGRTAVRVCGARDQSASRRTGAADARGPQRHGAELGGRGVPARLRRALERGGGLGVRREAVRPHAPRRRCLREKRTLLYSAHTTYHTSHQEQKKLIRSKILAFIFRSTKKITSL